MDLTQRHFELIDHLDRASEIEADWRRLFARAGEATPFLDFDWVMMCWRRLGSVPMHPRPFIATLREAGELVAMLPLMRLPHLVILRRYHGMRSLLPHYDDALFLADGDNRARAVALLAGLNRDWLATEFALNTVPETSALHAATAGRRRSEALSGAAPYVDLSEGFDAYMAHFRSRTRGQLNRQMRELEAGGEVRLRQSSLQRFDADFDWLLQRKRAWVPPKGGLRPWLQSAEVERDLRLLARTWVPDGRMWLSNLEVGDRTIAACLSLVTGASVYCFVVTYDPAYAHASPGRLLLLQVLADAAKRGITRYDMMTGDYAWKDRLKSGDVPLHRIRVRLGQARSGA